jgi:hypothetical protein
LFVETFQKELNLRMTNPSSIEHGVSILYTIGGYSNKDLTPESVKMIPRVEEFTEVNLITVGL